MIYSNLYVFQFQTLLVNLKQILHLNYYRILPFLASYYHH
jgi:hypothetical protein